MPEADAITEGTRRVSQLIQALIGWIFSSKLSGDFRRELTLSIGL